ncbi:MAG: phenylalanine--tRNA ligase subunit alpha [Methanoregulaceae archaeon]|nr:phenylalanine--tRNA ligase subunit alpha [Methanoregulaceae archaeon]
MELTLNEKRLLAVLGRCKTASTVALSQEMGARDDAIVQYALLLCERGLATIRREVRSRYLLTDEGQKYVEGGLPERQILNRIKDRTSLKELTNDPLSRIGIGWLRKKGWVTVRDGFVEKADESPEGTDERALKSIGEGRPPEAEGVQELAKRGLVKVDEDVLTTVCITEAGEAMVAGGLDLREEVGTLTREQIISGDWQRLPLKRYDVGKLPKTIFPGKVHPYQRLINEMRDILLFMGFTEIYGGVVQSSFWNFDALFQPQDHPAREMQDTFYLSERMPVPPGYEKVCDMHEHGGETSSAGWGGRWMINKAEQCVLRTHTTSLSIQHLAAHPSPPVKAFCINRVYRRESIDPTHTPEFEQLEGIVMDSGVHFGHLLGYLKEFYRRMGFQNVRFRPAYFPYTEPSVEPEVYINGLGWVELGGAGIFRQEVTAPWGIEYPVLAWGLGVSRVAMLKMGLKDLRMLYRSDIEWVRESPICRPEIQVQREP